MTHRIHCLPNHSMRSLRLALVAFVFAMPSATSAEELGRLFFTPERRQQLDHQRQFNLEEQREAPDDPTLTINGVVTRSSGKRTVWVNGIMQNETDFSNKAWVAPLRKDPGRVIIQPDSSPDTKARVGDTVNRDTGKSTDLLNGGLIKIRPITQ